MPRPTSKLKRLAVCQTAVLPGKQSGLRVMLSVSGQRLLLLTTTTTMMMMMMMPMSLMLQWLIMVLLIASSTFPASQSLRQTHAVYRYQPPLAASRTKTRHDSFRSSSSYSF